MAVKQKHPITTPIKAAYSPNLEPPKRFTKYLLAKKSAHKINIVSNAIDT